MARETSFARGFVSFCGDRADSDSRGKIVGGKRAGDGFLRERQRRGIQRFIVGFGVWISAAGPEENRRRGPRALATRECVGGLVAEPRAGFARSGQHGNSARHSQVPILPWFLPR